MSSLKARLVLLPLFSFQLLSLIIISCRAFGRKKKTEFSVLDAAFEILCELHLVAHSSYLAVLSNDYIFFMVFIATTNFQWTR